MPLSNAGTGLGSTLTITRVGGAATRVGELKSMKLAGRQVKTDDTTNFDSEASEFIPTVLTSGTWDIAGHRIGGDAGQIEMEAALAGLELPAFSIQLRKTQNQTVIGDRFDFTAMVEAIDYDIQTEKAQTFTGKIKISGLMTKTAGS